MKDFGDEHRQNLEARAKRKTVDGDFALSLATAVFIQVMRAQNTLFELGLESDLDACDRSVIEVWEPYFKSKHVKL